MKSIKEIQLGQRIICPACGQDESFKEHQVVGQTQWMRWSDQDGVYWYEEVETDEVIRAEDIVCAKCGAVVAQADPGPDPGSEPEAAR